MELEGDADISTGFDHSAQRLNQRVRLKQDTLYTHTAY
jgi:hypothetical protein